MYNFFPFAKRTYRELLRDPVSLIFGLAFPLILMVVLQIICKNVYTSGSDVLECYEIDKLMIGISVYSFSFTSFYAGIRVSKDKNEGYIQRFYSSRLKLVDFLLGYIAPLLLITFMQSVMCVTTAFILDAILSLDKLSFGFNYFIIILMMLPCELIFIFIGLMLGCSFKAKESFAIFILIIIITLMTGNIFFPAESFGSGYVIFCKILPFYPTVTALSCLINGFSEAFPYYYVTLGYLVVLFILTIVIFRIKMYK